MHGGEGQWAMGYRAVDEDMAVVGQDGGLWTGRRTEALLLTQAAQGTPGFWPSMLYLQGRRSWRL